MEINNSKTKDVLHWFKEISKIPRCSKNEAAISKWLENWAQTHNLESKFDDFGNILIKVPASPGCENAPAIVLQGHMDMVCEKNNDSNHDFTKDPIEFIFDGEWLKANKTSLGADNGIAIAMALTAALDKEIKHPKLELLFTLDEETGLNGATNLGTDLLEGKILLNIDSDEVGIFTIGCAGGKDTDISIPLEFEDINKDKKPYLIKAFGMKGGHSGTDIILDRANAIVVLARTLNDLRKNSCFNILSINGGTAHNAIPRDAQALILLNQDDYAKTQEKLHAFEDILKTEYKLMDPGLSLSIEEATFNAGDTKACTCLSSKKLINTILGFPHGVAHMDKGAENLVQTSSNLAIVKIVNDNLEVLSSQRSSLTSRLLGLSHKIESIAAVAGGTSTTGNGYPPWEANWDSNLLTVCNSVYKEIFNKDAVVDVIHAGLECGIIGNKYPGMEMVSFGPTIKNAHSPDEKLKISDIEKVYDLVVGIMKAYL
ncbi:MAG: aminoacyl-histidine dipeptidase [Pseudomonadota bacterium]